MGAVDICPGCGLSGGRKTCQDIFNDVSLRVRALAWTDSLKSWRLMHDVYALQHPDDQLPTYRDLILHLGGVAWAIEFDGSERGYRALQQVANRPSWQHEPFPPPGLPAERGTVRINSLEALSEPLLLVAGIDRWARATWLAYAPVQPIARDWVHQATALLPRP